jgi:DNA invertase Pin-like site-specific DNA recombinase
VRRRSLKDRCAIYVRTAVAVGNAAVEQRASCFRFARAKGWTCADHVYEDVGASGMDLDRPGLARLLHDADAGRFGRVVVTDAARLARDVCLLGEVVRRLSASGVDVVVVGAERADLEALFG